MAKQACEHGRDFRFLGTTKILNELDDSDDFFLAKCQADDEGEAFLNDEIKEEIDEKLSEAVPINELKACKSCCSQLKEFNESSVSVGFYLKPDEIFEARACRVRDLFLFVSLMNYSILAV